VTQTATLSRSTVKGKPLTREATFVPSSVNIEARTVDVCFTTGAKGKRFGWFGDEWFEELEVSQAAMRLDRMNNRAPFLAVHRAYSLEGVLGVIERSWIEGGKGFATVRFSKREDVEPMFKDVCDGILSHISVGYRVFKWQDVTVGDDKIKTMRAVDWEPYEASLVPIGFDDNATVRELQTRADATETFEMEVFTRALPGQNQGSQRTMSQKNNGTEAPTNEGGNGEGGEGGTTTAAPAKTRKADPVDPEAIRKAERERVADISDLCRKHGVDAETEKKYLRDGTKIGLVRKAILERLADGSKEQNVSGRVVVTAGAQDETEVRGRAAEAALMHRIAPHKVKLDEVGQRFAGMGLREMARAFLEAQGVRTGGWSPSKLAEEALRVRNANSSSDFPNILANVAKKTLLQNYDAIAAKQSFRPLVKVGYNPDFKQSYRVRAGEMPSLVKTTEGAEVTSGSMGESKETVQLATYSRKFAITRETIINDDLNAFGDLPGRFGMAAARLESDLVWAVFTGAVTMGDNVALFHATHGNLAGSGAVISVATIGAGRAAMRTQKGVNKLDALNIAPRFLIVPAAIETTADQFVSQSLLAAQSSNVNPFAGRLQVISEARLDAASATAWFLAGAVEDGVDLIELTFLEGQAGPVVETRMGFDVNGVEIKALHDVAAKALDWRGLYKNPGA
jgi:hypothetical protein